MSQEKLELLRLEETALLMFEFLDQWSDYRIETEDLEDLGELPARHAFGHNHIGEDEVYL